MNKNLYYIIAGEPSGDLHGANLINEIKKIDVSAEFQGLGGPLMQQAGLKTTISFQRLSVMGFWEVLRDLRFFLQLKKKIISSILQLKPKKIILIDYPGFNLSLAKSLKQIIKTPILYYISPQVWAWKKKRVSLIKKYVDKLIVVFPFEIDWFKKHDLSVEFFGHPLIDQFKKTDKQINSDNSKTIALFPGSRSQEIKKHLPLLNKTSRVLKEKNPHLNFILNITPGLSKQKIQSLVDKNIKVVQEKSSDVFLKSCGAIVTSGTATLECAITKTPFVVIYKTSFISWLIAKSFLSVPFICIVNLLANKEIIPELVQKEATPQKIANQLLKILNNSKKIKKDLKEVKDSLGRGDAYIKTAKYIVRYD